MAPRYLAAVLACLGAGGACASPFLMPEGTRELQAGVVLGNHAEDEGRRTRTNYVAPHFEARWSNGVFLQGLSLGMQLSATPGLRYGPLLALGRERTAAPGRDTRLMPLFGAFMNYQLLHNLHVVTNGYRMAGSRGGIQASLLLATHYNVAPHHVLVLAAGVRLADRRFLQTHLGAGPDAKAGVKDSGIEGRWQWELTPKYTASATVEARRLHGDAATGSLVTRRTGVGYSLMLVRGF